MQKELIEKFRQHFKHLDKVVKEEEVLILLDNNIQNVMIDRQVQNQFNRKIFGEMKQTMDQYNIPFTPLNFAKMYHKVILVLQSK